MGSPEKILPRAGFYDLRDKSTPQELLSHCAMEDNEWSFCRLWTDRLRVDDCADVLVNARLAGDYFFNRARTEGCPDKTEGSVAAEFWNRQMDCYLYFRSESKHQVVDKMYTLWLKNHKAIQDSLDGHVIDKARIPVWVQTFCRAFDVAWEDEVSRIMNASFDRLDLLVCYVNGRPAGCAALFGKNNVTSLYCLGTIPEFRGRGVAKSLIRESASIASKHGSDFLFVQSLESEGSLAFYQKAGFQVVYQKTICLLPRPV